ncbi:MAG: EAL domain-containing protein [Roseibium sp.]|nr:EAL domain-containing protein [Roseibium sp.]
MQVSHRFHRSRREKSGRSDSSVLAGFYRSLLEVLPASAAYVAADGQVLACNERFEAACLRCETPLVPSGLEDVLSPESWKRCQRVLATAFSGVPSEVSGAITLRSGARFSNQMSCTSPVSLGGGRLAVLVQFEEDNTPLELFPEAAPEADRRAAHSDVRFEPAVFLRSFPDDVLLFDGTESHEEKAIMLLEVVGSRQDMAALVDRLAALDGTRPATIHISECEDCAGLVCASERKVSEIRLVPLAGSGSRADTRRGELAIIRREMECPEEASENRRLAYQDPLTGLENRRAFERSLTREMKRLEADSETGLAVFYVDLDEFKKVNDHGGHDAGDEMLLRVADCLRLTLGEFGTAARIGGDEFACMLPVANEEAALETAQQILASFDRIRLDVADRVFTIGGSIGVAFVANDQSAGTLNAAALLGLADRACLRGKRVGGRSVQVQTVQSLDFRVAASNLSEGTDPLDFSNNDLVLFSMPIRSLRQETTCGIEVLARLRTQGEWGVSSRAWISAAERCGFIAQLDAWTLERVMEAVAQCNEPGFVAMNVSAYSAREPDFRDTLYHRLSDNRSLASRLCFEISERDFLREPGTVEGFFRLASDLGCQTALDDFGGHWPVLSRLIDMPITWLKFEAGLTQQIADSAARATILQGMVNTAHDLNIRCVAKHVTQECEAAALRRLDVDAAQGFLYGTPEPLEGVTQAL